MDAPGPLMSYIAGVAAFVAPCTLVLVPFYLAFLSGTAALAGRGGARAVLGRVASGGRWFAVGFVLAFVLVWSFPDSFDTVVQAQRVLERVGGAALILFGLVATGLLLASLRLTGGPGALFPLLGLLIGATFAAGWTPCVGNTLSRVLGMTGGPQGGLAALLLIVYGFGLMTPFMALGWGTGWLARRAAGRNVLRWAGPPAGALLIVIGVIVFTGELRDITAQLYALYPGVLI